MRDEVMGDEVMGLRVGLYGRIMGSAGGVPDGLECPEIPALGQQRGSRGPRVSTLVEVSLVGREFVPYHNRAGGTLPAVRGNRIGFVPGTFAAW